MTTRNILEARERRWLHKTSLAARYGGSVLSLALNVPGPDKNLPGTAGAFAALCGAAREALPELFTGRRLLCEEITPESADGPYALWVFAIEPETLKRAALALEESHPLGRLADLDVYAENGGVLSRRELGLPPRRCFLCGEEAALCRRKGSHPLEETVAFARLLLAGAAPAAQAQTSVAATAGRASAQRPPGASNGEKLVYTAKHVSFPGRSSATRAAGHVRPSAKAALIGVLAVRAAKSEASTSPKPGLVCPDTQGAHSDMDISLMLASADSLAPYFRQAAEHGLATAHLPATEAFPGLRALGVEAENTMLRATGGVNTHKGLVFSLGLLSAAAGRCLALRRPLESARLCATAAEFICGITAKDFAPILEFRKIQELKYANFADNNHVAKAGNIQPGGNSRSRARKKTWEADNAAASAAAVDTGTPEARCCAELLRMAAGRLGRKLTAGERLFLLHGVTGIRGEAESGFPHLLQAKKLFDALAGRHSLDVAAVNSLLLLMARTSDTNVLHRGGPAALERLKREAGLALKAGGLATGRGRERIRRLEQTCLELYVSPGGCADLLALLFFLHFIEESRVCLRQSKLT